MMTEILCDGYDEIDMNEVDYLYGIYLENQYAEEVLSEA